MSNPPFEMPGHSWDPEKKRFFKNKPKLSSASAQTSTSTSSASVSFAKPFHPKSSKRKQNSICSLNLAFRRQAVATQLLGLRRATHHSKIISSGLNSSIFQAFKSDVTDQFMSKMKLTHKDTLPLQLGRHPITSFADVLRDQDGKRDLDWLYVGDSSGALWQILASFQANDRLLSLPLLRADENGHLFSPNHTPLESTAAYLTHHILSPPLISIRSNNNLVGFLDSEGLKLVSRRSIQRSRLEPFKSEDQIFKADRFEIRCFEIFQDGSMESVNDHYLVAIGGDYKIQFVLVSVSQGSETSIQKIQVKSEIVPSNQQIMSLEFLDKSHLLLGTRSGEIHFWEFLANAGGIKVISKEKLDIGKMETATTEDQGKREENRNKGKSKRTRHSDTNHHQTKSEIKGRGSIVHLKRVDNGSLEIRGSEIVVSWTSGELCLLVLQITSSNSKSLFGAFKKGFIIKTSFKGHSNSYLFDLGLALDSRNRCLAVAGSDRKVRIWKLDSAEPLEDERGGFSEVESEKNEKDDEVNVDGIHSPQRSRKDSTSCLGPAVLPKGSSLASITFSQPIKTLMFLDRCGFKGGFPMLAVGDGNQVLYFQ